MDYSRYLTTLSQNRKSEPTCEIMSLQARNTDAEVVFLAVGRPNDATVPYTEITLTVDDGKVLKLESEELMEALQYGPTQGYPPLVEEIKLLVKKFHSPPCWETTDLVVTPGGQDGLAKSIEMMMNEGDYFVTQEPLYVGTLCIIGPYKPNIISVPCDNHGMDPKFLRYALSKWDPRAIRDQVEGIPKVLYVNPNGGNPTGTTLTEERKREIYQIASEYNLIILEDDPYYFLQFSDMKDYIPSFLSMDVDGRVIRFDSFSKLISPGIRLGFTTGPKALVNRIQLHIQSTYAHASSLSQSIVYKTLKHWGHAGLVEHVSKLKNIYVTSRDLMLAAANKHLEGLCEWFVPTSGMFFWIKVLGVADTYEMILQRGMKKNVILLPGRTFMTNPDAPSPYLRASYSSASPAEIEKGFRYLAELIREELLLQN